MNIGIYCGSFKPLHNAHYEIIKKASIENDIVLLIVSLKDRIKKDEFPIRGKHMAIIWQNHLQYIMPKNVNTIFVLDSPVKKVYSILSDFEKIQDKNIFNIYGGKKDLEKYFSKLNYHLECINIIKIERNDMSGTKMRSFLMNNDKNSFIINLPTQLNGDEIYNILTSNKEG